MNELNPQVVATAWLNSERQCGRLDAAFCIKVKVIGVANLQRSDDQRLRRAAVFNQQAGGVFDFVVTHIVIEAAHRQPAVQVGQLRDVLAHEVAVGARLVPVDIYEVDFATATAHLHVTHNEHNVLVVKAGGVFFRGDDVGVSLTGQLVHAHMMRDGVVERV